MTTNKMEDKFKFITVRKETKDQLRQMCKKEGFTYDFLIRELIKVYQGGKDGQFDKR